MLEKPENLPSPGAVIASAGRGEVPKEKQEVLLDLVEKNGAELTGDQKDKIYTPFLPQQILNLERQTNSVTRLRLGMQLLSAKLFIAYAQSVRRKSVVSSNRCRRKMSSNSPPALGHHQ